MLQLADHPLSGHNQKQTKTQKKLFLGAWNVRTFLDREDTARSERRTVLVAKELACYNIDIAALSETCLPDEGSLTELTSGYTFFWKGKAQTKYRIHGVRLAVRTSLLKNLLDLPVGIRERLMKICLPLNHKRFATVISTYAPTLTSTEGTTEQFYSDLSSVLHSVPVSNKLILLGDFNARVSQNHIMWKGVLGKHGVGKMNWSTSAQFELISMANKYKTTWMHPRSKQWHMIDYIIVCQRDIQDT